MATLFYTSINGDAGIRHLLLGSSYHHIPFSMACQSSLLTKIGFVLLAFNSALAIRNSWGDAGSVSFVLAADGALLLLFLCLARFERAAAGGGAGRSTKVPVWLLTTLLTAMFASRVAPLMPPPVGAVVWTMSAVTAAAGFWAFFLQVDA